MEFQTKSPINNSTLAIIKLVAAQPINHFGQQLDEFDFWNPKTKEDCLMRDGAIDFARNILDLEKIDH